MVLFMAVLCFVALYLAGISVAADTAQLLHSYEGNITEKEILPVDMLSILGPPGYFFAETTKFKAPKAGWKLNTVQMYGWDGFNGSSQSIPAERVIGLEIRDKDLNLLYKFADSQLPYSNYARNATTIYPLTIEIPSIPVSDDFYVCFYDRGAVAIASERLNATSKNSFLFIEAGKQLVAAAVPVGKNESIPVNWIMTVSGS
jgi:hypothetical protein